MQKNPRNAQDSSIPSIPAEGSGETLERPEVGADYYDDSAARNVVRDCILIYHHVSSESDPLIFFFGR